MEEAITFEAQVENWINSSSYVGLVFPFLYSEISHKKLMTIDNNRGYTTSFLVDRFKFFVGINRTLLPEEYSKFLEKLRERKWQTHRSESKILPAINYLGWEGILDFQDELKWKMTYG